MGVSPANRNKYIILMCPSQNYESHSGKHQNANLINVNPLGTYFKFTIRQQALFERRAFLWSERFCKLRNDANKLIEFFLAGPHYWSKQKYLNITIDITQFILVTKHDPTCCLGLLKERETGGSWHKCWTIGGALVQELNLRIVFSYIYSIIVCHNEPTN